jgi:hypothetical protein
MLFCVKMFKKTRYLFSSTGNFEKSIISYDADSIREVLPAGFPELPERAGPAGGAAQPLQGLPSAHPARQAHALQAHG